MTKIQPVKKKKEKIGAKQKFIKKGNNKKDFAGFVSAGVLSEGDGATAMAPVRLFKKLPQLQVRPISGQGRANQ